MKLIACRSCRQKQQEQDIHGLTIDGVELDGLPKTHQHPEWLPHLRHPGMWDSNPTPGPSGTQLFALEQFRQDAVRRHVESLTCLI